MRKYNVIDLFSGAGGLSEGFLQTNRFNFIAHVEWEKPMVDTLRENLITRWGYTQEEAIKAVIKFDIQKTEELINGKWSKETINQYGDYNSHELVRKGLKGLVGRKKVDMIIGGPPCQAYSLAGRAQDPNSMKNDYRNFLFESFVKVVEAFRPKVFVFENVPGILSAKPGDRLVIERICEVFEKIGYEVRLPKDMKNSIYTAADFEVPQERRRIIIFGVDKKMGLSVEKFYEALNSLKCTKKRTVRDAIGEMPKFIPLDKSYKKGNRNYSHELVGNELVSLHNARYHNKRDIKVFYDWLTNYMNYIPNDEKLKYYEKVTGKHTNHNKYRSLEWDKPSPTVVAHLYKDGLMFIHPDIEQLRSITIREAALLQSFPIDYKFVGSDAYCYKMVGNAVPVLLAKSIAKAIIKVLEKKI